MKIIKTILLIALVVIVSACNSSKYGNLDDGLYADIETDKGNIVMELYFEELPLTVSNFVSLAEGNNPKVEGAFKGKKYYDGVTFHRVVPNFMIQGGDPTATGRSNPGYLFEDEFPKNDKDLLIYKHDGPGVLSMANGGPGKNGSQFFITLNEAPWLDGFHTIFGKVVFGQDVVNAISKADVMKHVTFIRIGEKAENFDASKVFEVEFEKSIQAKTKRLKAEKEAVKLRKEQFDIDAKAFKSKMGIAKAKKTSSGLQILTLKRGRGKKFNRTEPATMHYTISLAAGKMIQSTVDSDPFLFNLSDQPMIPGVTEALLKMRQGGKVRLFIPYYLAYGEKGYGPFPPKADVIFEFELLKVGK